MKNAVWKRSIAALLSCCIAVGTTPAVLAEDVQPAPVEEQLVAVLQEDAQTDPAAQDGHTDPEAAEDAHLHSPDEPLPLEAMGEITPYSVQEVPPQTEDIPPAENDVISAFALPSGVFADDNYIYLSDLTPTRAEVGYGQLRMDRNPANSTISLLIDGKKKSFAKGIGAHAASVVEFDLSEISGTHSRLTGYAGLDASREAAGNGIAISVYVAKNAAVEPNWEELTEYTTDNLKGTSNAVALDIDLTDVKAISLRATTRNNNSSDHAVWADMVMLKNGYTPPVGNEGLPFKTFAEYTSIIQDLTAEQVAANADKLYGRKVVERLGFDALKAAYLRNDRSKAAIDWLFNSTKRLQDFVVAGRVNGSAAKALDILIELYNTYKTDLEGSEGEMYARWVIAMTIGNAHDVKLWVGKGHISDPVKRFEVYKNLLADGKLKDPDIIRTAPTPLLRYLFNAEMADEEIEWLVDMSNELHNGKKDPYQYIRYSFDYNYKIKSDSQYVIAANRDKWNEQYDLDKYGIEYGDGDLRLWMVFEEEGVCGTISKTGTVLEKSYGFPSIYIGQPGHGAYVSYSVKDGDGHWNIGNDVGGYSVANTGSLPLEWGVGVGGFNLSYILLGQAALNDYNTYLQANEQFLWASSLMDNAAKMQAYQDILALQPYNLDAMQGLIKTYSVDSSKTSGDYLALAIDIMERFKFYPLPMVNLLKSMESKVTVEEHRVEMDILRTNALKTAANATDAQSLQANHCRTMARSLLGTSGTETATFSFDGSNAGKIVLDESYDGYGVRIMYSLDGEKPNPERQTTEHEITLTQEELDSISPDHDIIIGFVGTAQTYRIEIAPGIPIEDRGIYANDDEDLLIGKLSYLEYSQDDGATWQDYTGGLSSTTRFTGDQVVTARYKRHGNIVDGPNKTFTFTNATDTPERKYLPLQHLSVRSTSQPTLPAKSSSYAIDGLKFSAWHGDPSSVDTEKTILLQLDQMFYVKGMSVYSEGQSGRFKSGTVSVSLDAQTWEYPQAFTNFANDATVKTMSFERAYPAKYLKIQLTETYGGNKSVGANMLWFYYDSNHKASEDDIVSAALGAAKTNGVAKVKSIIDPSQYIEEDRAKLQTWIDFYVDKINNAATVEEVTMAEGTAEYFLPVIASEMTPIQEPEDLKNAKDALRASITSATEVMTSVKVSSQNGTDYYPEDKWVADTARQDFESAITNAQTALQAQDATVESLEATTASLERSKSVFQEGIQNGTATNDIYAVETPPVITLETLTPSAANLTMTVGDEKTVGLTASPAQATYTPVWSVENSGVVSVDQNGKITALGAGTSKVYATVGAIQAICTVTVSAPEVLTDSIKLSDVQLFLEIGQEHTITATVQSDDETFIPIWTVSDASVLSVDQNGKVTAKKEGTATVKAACCGQEAVCTVEVLGAGIRVQYDAQGKMSITNRKAQEDRRVQVIRAYYDADGICIGTSVSKAVQDTAEWSANGFVVPAGTVTSKTYVLACDRSLAPLFIQTDA